MGKPSAERAHKGFHGHTDPALGIGSLVSNPHRCVIQMEGAGKTTPRRKRRTKCPRDRRKATGSELLKLGDKKTVKMDDK